MINPFDYDLHTHTRFSDGRNSVREMVNAARANGIRGFVLADHVFSPEQAEKLLGEYAKLDRSSFPVNFLFGCETAVAGTDGRLCAPPEMLRKFEIVLVDCNQILFNILADSEQSSDALYDILCGIMIEVCRSSEVKIFAHPFNFGLAPLKLPLEGFTDERVGRVAEAFAKNGKIFEIMNQMYFWHTTTSFEHFHAEYSRIIGIMKQAGVHFSLGSDAHSCCGIGNLPLCRRVVKEQGLSEMLFLPEVFVNSEWQI